MADHIDRLAQALAAAFTAANVWVERIHYGDGDEKFTVAMPAAGAAELEDALRRSVEAGGERDELQRELDAARQELDAVRRELAALQRRFGVS
jgi:uncharacterized protein (DUF3084 family)